MNYDDMIQAINEINALQNISLDKLPHCSNLIHQLEKRETKKETLFNDIVKKYLDIRNIDYDNNLGKYIVSLTEMVNSYMNFFWPPTNNPFSHQTDFTSSIIPEMLCLIFDKQIKCIDIELEVSAQSDLAIECIFDISNGGSIRLKNKRVDVAVVKPCELSFNGSKYYLPIPLLAIECKTHLDKNMLSGIEHSVSDLKKTFPDCCYLVISELSDFNVNKTNYASSSIDEMYILRKQKRAIVRKNANARKNITSDLFFEITQRLDNNIKMMKSNTPDLQTRMNIGKLIGR